MNSNQRSGLLMVFGIIAAVALGGTQLAFSKKHSHQVKTDILSKEVVSPADDVGTDSLSCPAGYQPTGGGVGYIAGAGSPVASGFLDRWTYYIVINNLGVPFESKNAVQIACIKGKTSKVNGRVLSRPQIEAALEAKVEALRKADDMKATSVGD